jgi:hypothetical protein
VIVLNEHEPFVRVFDSAGRLVQAAGLRGEGPGELQYPGRLFAAADGSFRVLDAGRMEFVAYGPEGAVGESIRFSTTLGVVPNGISYDATRETLYMTGTRLGEVVPAVARFRLDGSGWESLWSGTDLPGVGTTYEVDEDGHPSHFAVAVGRGGEIAVGNGYHYRIVAFDSDGAVRSQFVRDLERRPKTAEQYEAERRRASPRWEPTPEFPHFRSTSLQFDEEGRLWVRRTDSDTPRTAFDVFHPDRGFLGPVEFDVEPIDWRMHSFEVRGGRLAMIGYDDTGNTRVWVWELRDGS